jgi:hypothetical protein
MNHTRRGHTYACIHGHLHDGNRPDGSTCPDETRGSRRRRSAGPRTITEIAAEKARARREGA